MKKTEIVLFFYQTGGGGGLPPNQTISGFFLGDFHGHPDHWKQVQHLSLDVLVVPQQGRHLLHLAIQLAGVLLHQKGGSKCSYEM